MDCFHLFSHSISLRFLSSSSLVRLAILFSYSASFLLNSYFYRLIKFIFCSYPLIFLEVSISYFCVIYTLSSVIVLLRLYCYCCPFLISTFSLSFYWALNDILFSYSANFLFIYSYSLVILVIFC